MKVLKGFISVLALGLVAFVVVGLLLPSSWSTERTRTLAAPPDQVFPWLEDLARWREWSAMGQVEGILSDPSRGAGATLEWDDPQWGAGTFRITEVAPDRRVLYEVEVEDGSIRTRGSIHVSPGDSGGTDIRWREEGDLGWNPLLAYFALGMERMQGDELDKSMDRLQALLEG
jgi:uncharacterized protein YndB with AHSA1/START domain